MRSRALIQHLSLKYEAKNTPPILYLTSGTRRIEQGSAQEFTVMTRWHLLQVVSLTGQRSRHLIGRAEGVGRLCTGLKRIDLGAMTALTQSGRIYVLEGPPGYDEDAEYLWNQRKRYHPFFSAFDVTRALVKLRSQRTST